MPNASSPENQLNFWKSAQPETICERLGAPDFVPDSISAGAVRDRAAAYLASNPSQSDLLASALLDAVSRTASAVDAETRAVAWRCRAEAYLYTGRQKDARQAYARATEEAEVSKNHRLLGQILVGRVGVLNLVGETAAAAQLAARAERVLRRAGDLVYLGRLFLNRGNALYDRERYAEAYDAYRRASRVLSRIGLRDATWAGLLMNRAIVCRHLLKFREARQLYRESETLSGELGLELLGAHARYNRAFLERLRGDYRAALTLLEEAGAAFGRLGSQNLAAASDRSRAEIYLELGMPGEARDLARAAAASFSESGMDLDAVLARVVEAQSLVGMGSAGRAAQILETARRFYAARRMRPRNAAALLFLARSVLGLGQSRRALMLARRALEIFASLEMPNWMAESHMLVAEALLALGRAGEAEAALGPALDASASLSAGGRQALWALAGRVSLFRDHRRESERRLRRAVQYLELQRRLIPGVEFRARAFEKQVGVYHDLLSLSLASRAPRFGKLLALVESARARSFRDRLTIRSVADRDAIAERRALLGSLTRRLEEAEFGGEGEPDPAAARELRRQTRVLERELAERLRQAERSEDGAPVWRGVADPAPIARRLGRDETLLEYFVHRDRVLALVLHRQAAEFRVLPDPATEIRRRVERVRFQLDAMALSADRSAAHPDFLRRSAEAALARLYQSLLEPLGALLPASGRRLLVVPHAFLHQVPFEALFDGTRYLDARWCVTRCPTADFLLRRPRRRSHGQRGKVVVCGTIRSGPASAAAEIEAVAASFRRADVRLLRDPTARDILDAVVGCRILHLSAHGVFRDDNPLFSRLSTPDGGLFLADIFGLKLSAELVVLSACSAGRVFTGLGDDLAGVAHGFLAAGAKQVVASRWRVHDAATRALVEAFYAAYNGAAAGDPARSLLEAGRHVRRDWDHPFHWGSFSVHGA